MPKTHTNDVAPALPSSIEGPFQVADAADHDSHLTIDPAMAKISAAGGARPLRRRFLGLVKNTGTSSSATLGTGMACRQVTPGNDGGFFAAPMGIPSDMDLSAPSSVFVLIAASGDSSLADVAVRIEVVAGYAQDGQASAHATTVTCDHPVPDSWQSGAAEVVRVDDGNGRTFAANVFEAGDVLGLRVQLARSAAADTFDQGVKLATGVIFEYTANQI